MMQSTYCTCVQSMYCTWCTCDFNIECLEALFEHPLFHDKLNLVPRCVYCSTERLIRVYSKWMTDDVAWDIQVRPLSAGEF